MHDNVCSNLMQLYLRSRNHNHSDYDDAEWVNVFISHCSVDFENKNSIHILYIVNKRPNQQHIVKDKY